jgi:hypothetical protein
MDKKEGETQLVIDDAAQLESALLLRLRHHG